MPRGPVKTTVDAVFEGGVFRPARRPDLSEGERVRITVESVSAGQSDDVLSLAAQVYAGLSPGDVDEIEEIARRRSLFSDIRR